MATKKKPFKEKVENSELGKIPPQALELEEAVLGAMMLEQTAVNSVIDVLSPSSFYKPAHQKIFDVIQNLFNDSEPIDLLTVTEALKKSCEEQKKGITTFIEVILNQELGEPFRRDAMKKPVKVADINKNDMKPQQS